MDAAFAAPVPQLHRAAGYQVIQPGPVFEPGRSWNTMDQTSEKKRRSIRIGLILAVLAVVWYVIAMFLVVKS